MLKPARLAETSVGALVAVVGDAEQIRRCLGRGKSYDATRFSAAIP